MNYSHLPERILGALCIAVLGAFLVAYLWQRSAIPGVLQYVPVNNEGFLVTSSLDELWSGFEPHLAHFFVEPEGNAEPTFIGGLALELKKNLRSGGVEIHGPNDLPRLGIDGARSAAIVFVYRDAAPQFIVVVPVIDQALFGKTLERLVGSDASKQDKEHNAVRRVGKYFLGYGADSMAVVGMSGDVVHEILERTSGRLAQFASDDRLVRLLAAPLPRVSKLPALAWLRGRFRMANVAPVGGDLEILMSADEFALAISSRLDVPSSRSALLRSLLLSDPPYDENPALTRSIFALSMTGPALAELISDVKTITPGSGPAILGQFSPVIAELERSASLSRVSAVVSDPRARVPGLAVGLRMTVRDAEALVFRLQSSLRIERDSQILGRASRQRHSDGEEKPSSPRTLVEAGLLDAEPGALWDRYAWNGEGYVPTTGLSQKDFAIREYLTRSSDGVVLNYLMPPFTGNDIRYRFANDTAELNLDDLRADRYRLCSAYVNDTLWVANDARGLENWIGRLSRDVSNVNYVEARALSDDFSAMKMHLVAQPREINEAAQVYPNNDVNKIAKDWFADLTFYRMMHFGISTDPRSESIHVDAIFLRR